MSKSLRGCFALSIVLLAGYSRVAAAAMPLHLRPDYLPGEVLVKFRSRTAQTTTVTQATELGLKPMANLMNGEAARYALPAFLRVRDAVTQLEALPGVAYAQPNYLRYRSAYTPNDPLFDQQWGLYNTGQANFVAGGPAGTPGADMHLPQAWDLNGDGVPDHTGNGSVTVAIVDDAFDVTHPDLAANFVSGYNFVDNTSDVAPSSDKQEHGTLVAGCLGAVGNNGAGVAGVAWNVKLLPIKFGFDTATEIEALEYARTHGAKVVNLSFGGPSYSQMELDEINRLAGNDILVVTSAGNEDDNLDFAGTGYPASYDADNLVAVAATNRQDDIASFSSYGPTHVDVAAPGLQIVTTTINNGYSTDPGVSGTSLSAPYVAGIAALIRMYLPGADYLETRARLLDGADPGDNASLLTAGGRVNAANSLSLSAQPALRLTQVTVDDTGSGDGDGALDPGETLNLAITVRNLWQAATAVNGTLSVDDPGVSINTPTVSFGNLATRASATGDFNITLPADIAGHRYLHFTLQLTDSSGYSVSRHFVEEIGKLTDGVTQSQVIGTDLYDEFHTWHLNFTGLPPGTDTLTFRTTAANDIDILVSRGQPAHYDIDLGASPNDPDALYYTDAPDSMTGAAPGGNEYVNIGDPSPGTYFVTVIDYDQTRNAQYTLEAFTNRGGVGGYRSSTLAYRASQQQPPSNGGGAVGGLQVIVFAGLAALQHRRRRRRGSHAAAGGFPRA